MPQVLFCIRDNFFGGYGELIDEICPEYLALMTNSNDCHTSNFLFGNGVDLTLDI